MNKKQANILLIIILFSSAFNNLAKAERQSLTSISIQAEYFLADYTYESPYEARFVLSLLDKRLNLKPCAQSLDIKFTRSQKVMGNTSLTIRCKAPVNWQIHLPVRIDIYDDIAVTKTPLIKGQSIDAKSIHFRKKKITDLHQGYFRKIDSLDRLQAKRNLSSNSILNSANVAAKHLVTSGQTVTILLKINGLQIKSTGLALQSASLGQLVKVRNKQSNKIIEGTVSSEGQVSVNL
ncbi:MAG: flagellar basal body P-ring formation protein FlgA [Gammaproteobacteria bacterium]|jgi:flagella basal body P-ring formation protein FlgA|nr:flagellar basal body P-ring formation protein FlgA [Gammaproteobacteria bacterium]MBT3723257.1 flagellar basal body P-ring formation protein FlgA [Gammaproteobacteria bacterium]MBT4077830.1 flagellar basal body P-ring formation protein FlgA [Gammaproteobacteria bacterium]MBT4196505.1 flagellar basal body P-ring formation protein FlgA [Gammaproteobacteria bacterium]MBT4450191.1 flagellar basal body P-ring formation protein FlgA [Gammaproteobacteria bacterium]